MNKYILRDPKSGAQEEVYAEDDDDAIEQASAWALAWGRDMDPEQDETFWIDVEVWLGDDFWPVTVAVDPKEPWCNRSSHDWDSPHTLLGGCEKNPGVFGNGGGVIIKEVCDHCGAYRVKNTWAQRPDNSAEGMKSIKYLKPDKASIDWINSHDE